MSYTSLVRQLFNYVKTGFLEEMAPSMAPAKQDWTSFPGGEHVVALTDTTIADFISSRESALIMFYAHWCGHCKSSKPEYAKAAQLLAKQAPGAALGAVDCEKYRAVFQKYNIAGYPTFHYYRNGKFLGEYNYGRRASDFVQFMLRNPSTKDEL